MRQAEQREESTRLVIITVPPPDLELRLSRLLERVGELTGAREALRYPPHITMRTGALVPSAELDEYIAGFSEHVERSPFSDVRISATRLLWSTYRSAGQLRHFIGYEIEPTDELLGLHRYLLSYDRYIKATQTSFWPHLSIAYHDLTPDAAALAAAELGLPPVPEELDASLGAAGGAPSQPSSTTDKPADPIWVPQWCCRNVGLYARSGRKWQPQAVFAL